MYNKEHLNVKRLLYKLPFYSVWIFYILKLKKFPYFMYYPHYRNERLMKQGLFIISGCLLINVGFNLYSILSEENEKQK